MGKKYLETKKDSLESSVLGVWKTAIEEGDARETAVMDGRTRSYKEHRAKLETARQRRESKRVNKEEVEIDEGYEKVVHLALKKNQIDGYFRDGILYVDKRDVKDAKDAIENDSSIRKAPKIVGEEVKIDEKHDTHVDPKAREELDKEADGEGGVETAKKMKRAKEPAPGQMAEASGDKEAYKKFFNAALKKFKVSSPAELKGDDKKNFFDYIDKNWEGDNEKAEAAMSYVREFKMQSMKDALVKIWGVKEGHNPFKTENHDDEENKKRVKTETGKKPAVIDLNPKIKDQ